MSMREALRQMPVQTGRFSVGRGEASFDLDSDVNRPGFAGGSTL